MKDTRIITDSITEEQIIDIREIIVREIAREINFLVATDADYREEHLSRNLFVISVKDVQQTLNSLPWHKTRAGLRGIKQAIESGRVIDVHKAGIGVEDGGNSLCFAHTVVNFYRIIAKRTGFSQWKNEVKEAEGFIDYLRELNLQNRLCLTRIEEFIEEYKAHFIKDEGDTEIVPRETSEEAEAESEDDTDGEIHIDTNLDIDDYYTVKAHLKVNDYYYGEDENDIIGLASSTIYGIIERNSTLQQRITDIDIYVYCNDICYGAETTVTYRDPFDNALHSVDATADDLEGILKEVGNICDSILETIHYRLEKAVDGIVKDAVDEHNDYYYCTDEDDEDILDFGEFVDSILSDGWLEDWEKDYYNGILNYCDGDKAKALRIIVKALDKVA